MSKLVQLNVRSVAMAIPLGVVVVRSLDIKPMSTESLVLGMVVWIFVVAFNASFIYAKKE